MKIENLSYKEFAMIREAIKEMREAHWKKSIVPKLRKDLTDEQIHKAKKDFNVDMNLFNVNGICNSILGKLEEEELKVQAELEVQE